MTKTIIVSDFDGTITKKDTLYYFFKEYASEGWEDIEQLWRTRQIGSKECLIKEFELVPNLSKDLINSYIKTIKIDSHFSEFIRYTLENNIDFLIVSDGIDYFIENFLKNNNLSNINIVTNHGEFKDGKFEVSCPNSNLNCKVNSGTCKCNIINNLKSTYDKIIYIGDGTSDYCVAGNKNIDMLFTKDSLSEYSKSNNIKHIEFSSFKDISDIIFRKEVKSL